MKKKVFSTLRKAKTLLQSIVTHKNPQIKPYDHVSVSVSRACRIVGTHIRTSMTSRKKKIPRFSMTNLLPPPGSACKFDVNQINTSRRVVWSGYTWFFHCHLYCCGTFCRLFTMKHTEESLEIRAAVALFSVFLSLKRCARFREKRREWEQRFWSLLSSTRNQVTCCKAACLCWVGVLYFYYACALSLSHLLFCVVFCGSFCDC